MVACVLLVLSRGLRYWNKEFGCNCLVREHKGNARERKAYLEERGQEEGTARDTNGVIWGL